MNIIRAIEHDKLFKPHFGGESWYVWRVILKAAFALEMTDAEKKTFYEIAERKPPKNQVDELWVTAGVRGGKALDLSTPIPTPDGWRTMGDLEDGDMVFGPDGQPTKVLLAHPIQRNRPCYEVKFANGERIVADAEHEWFTTTYSDRRNQSRRQEPIEINPDEWPEIHPQANYRDIRGQRFGSRIALRPVGKTGNGNILWLFKCDCGSYSVTIHRSAQHWNPRCCSNQDWSGSVKTTQELAQTQVRPGYKQANHAIPTAQSLRYGVDPYLPIDPYLLGLWLGDGSSKSGDITTGDPEIKEMLSRRGHEVMSSYRKATSQRITIIGLHGGLSELGLLKNKHIPYQYKVADKFARLELIRGLMDADGHANQKDVDFYNTNKRLFDDFCEVTQGLGCKVYTRERRAKLYGKDCGPNYTARIRSPYTLFYLQRKKNAQRLIEPLHYIRSVTPVESRPVRCITVDREDGLFLASESCIPTHNSRVIALIATYFACFLDYSPYLSAGEVPRILVMAAGKHQARTVFRYIEGLLTDVPVLSEQVSKTGQQQITMKSGLVIEVITNNYRALQSYTSPVVICDEIAFWNDETSANPGAEVINAARPRMATLPHGYRMLLAISSPFRREGILWEEYCEHFGQDDDPILMIHAPTWKLNPTLPQDYIKRQYEKDPYMASRYYGAEFRSDIEGFLDESWIEQCTNRDRPVNLSPQSVTYYAFVDASGGRGDAMTLSIGHVDSGVVVIDVITGRTGRFNPKVVAREFSEWLHQYGIGRAWGDRYAGEWVRDGFQEAGISFEVIDKVKSDIYLSAGPVFAQGQVEIPEHKQTIDELRSLERRSTRMGREVIDHPRHKSDDFANAVCGVIVLAHRKRRPVDLSKASFGSKREMIDV